MNIFRLKFKKELNLCVKHGGDSDFNLPLPPEFQERYEKGEELKILLSIQREDKTVTMVAYDAAKSEPSAEE